MRFSICVGMSFHVVSKFFFYCGTIKFDIFSRKFNGFLVQVESFFIFKYKSCNFKYTYAEFNEILKHNDWKNIAFPTIDPFKQISLIKSKLFFIGEYLYTDFLHVHFVYLSFSFLWTSTFPSVAFRKGRPSLNNGTFCASAISFPSSCFLFGFSGKKDDILSLGRLKVQKIFTVSFVDVH